MNALLWFLRGVLFIILLGLAIKNGHDIELRFYFDASWHAPLSVVLLVTLALGVLLGLLAVLPSWIRQRRSLGQLRRQLSDKPSAPTPGAQPPASV